MVGYAAIAFTSREARKPLPKSGGSQFTPEERRILLTLARKSVTAAVTGREGPKDDPAEPAKFRERRACFVTLTSTAICAAASAAFLRRNRCIRR